MHTEPPFTIGIEEEYLLVDLESRDLIRTAPPTMLRECERLLHDQVTPEFLQCQIEVGTRVSNTIQEARDDLAHLRKTVAGVAAEHGLGLIAASTHPFATWTTAQHTTKQRYEILARDMQAVARQLLICGMHVHVGLGNDDLRIDLMNQCSYTLPHWLALSTSSPFWEGQDTGLKSYRVAVWDQFPRSGMPPHFESFGEYQREVDMLVQTGVIEDTTKLWWDVRPSARFPTLEMRISDVCTLLDDAICIAALYRCWLRMLYRLKLNNQLWRKYSVLLLSENRWRAQRYGHDAGLIDFGRGQIVPVGELVTEILALVQEDAEYFDCVSELQHAFEILRRGTSAHRQLATYQREIESGSDDASALRAVVDMLLEETLQGL